MSEKPWFDKSNERTIGIPISRLPEYLGVGQVPRDLDLYCRLEEIIRAYDAKCAALEFMKKKYNVLHNKLGLPYEP